MPTPSKAQLLKAHAAKRKHKKRKTSAIQKDQNRKQAIGIFLLISLGIAFLYHFLLAKQNTSKNNKQKKNTSARNKISPKTLLKTPDSKVVVSHYLQASTTTITSALAHLASTPAAIYAGTRLLATMSHSQGKDFTHHTASIMLAMLVPQWASVNAKAENIEVVINAVPEAPQFATASAIRLQKVAKKGKKLTPDAQVADIKNQLTNRIIHTAKALEYYNQHPSSSFAHDSDQLTKTLLTIAKDRTLYCKLNSTHEETNTRFKYIITAQGETNSVAHYNVAVNAIATPMTLLARMDSYRTSVVEHEIHHAYLNYQNRKMGRLFFMPQTFKYDPSSTPCNPGLKKGTFDCDEVASLQQIGLKNVDEMLAEIDLKTAQEKLIAYQSALEGYQPIIEDCYLKKSQIDLFQQQRLLDEQFKFTDPEDYLDATPNDKEFKRYIYRIEVIGDQFVGYIQNYKQSEFLKAPLLDFKYMLKIATSSEKLRPLDVIKETDAVIHQIFGKYPKLFDFIFKDVRKYHEARSDPTYQRCIGYSPR